MTKLEELINELCPDGVEYKTVGEVCTIKKGAQLNKDKLKDNGLYPVVNGGVDPSGYWDEYNFNANLITISQGGASAGYVNFMTTPFWAGAHCYVVEKCEECLNYTYLYHFIKMHQKTFMQCQYGAGIPSLSLKSINAIGIPLPPLSIQSEIVHILDSFTLLTAELTTELTAELTARQKQYAFYRDYLLDFSNEDETKKIPDIDCSNVEYKRLGNIAIIERGKRVVRNDLSQEIGYPVYQNALKPLGYYTDKNRNANSVFIIGAGAAGEIGYSYVDYWAADDCFTFVCDDKLNQRYLYFLLMSKQAYLKNNVRKSSIPRLPRIALENMEIPVPPLSVQENIVKILDRFDKLNNDMSKGLPAEIEARKKQYEYYRDTLLSFDDKACSQIVKVERERELTRIKAIKWLKLCDIADIGTGSSNTNEALEVGKYPFFVRSQDVKRKDTYEFDETAIITSGDGVGVGKIFHFVEGKYALHQRAYRIHITDENVLPKYFFYYMKATFLNYIEKNSFHSSVTSVRRPMLNNYLVPVPPLEEQERIVSILDRFDKLCNDISEELPAEIEARHKQYEYYRDKLLTFKMRN